MTGRDRCIRSGSTLALLAFVLAPALGCGPGAGPAARGGIAPEAPPGVSIFLIGDAGEPDPRESSWSLSTLRRQADSLRQRTEVVVVFLGDNVYPSGVPDSGNGAMADALRRLDAQVASVPDGARGIFIPGNHDWGDGGILPEGADGLGAVRRQGQHIASWARRRGAALGVMPADGCPGPGHADVGRVRLIALDTQWWLHEFLVPADSASGCRPFTKRGIADSLTALVRGWRGGNRFAIVAAHHPLLTGGEHGAFCGFLAPLRRWAGNRQDTFSKPNSQMRAAIAAALRDAPPLIFAAGHDHNLQVLRGTDYGARYVLVSGAGSPRKPDCVLRLRETLHLVQHREGFMRLDVYDAEVRLTLFSVHQGRTVSTTLQLEDR